MVVEKEAIYECVPFVKKGGLLHGIYFSTYGGGPEGGYVLCGDYNNDEGFYTFPDGFKVFRVNREWSEKWSTIELENVSAYYLNDNDGESIIVLNEDEEAKFKTSIEKYMEIASTIAQMYP